MMLYIQFVNHFFKHDFKHFLHQNTISMSFHAFRFVAQDECSIAVFLKIGPGTREVPQTFRGSVSSVS